MRVGLVRSAMAVGLALAGCDGHGNDPGDDASVDARELTCGELAAQLRTLADRTSTACMTDDDCATVGYPVEYSGLPTCHCGAAFSQWCGGTPVNYMAWRNDPQVPALEEEWRVRCVQAEWREGVPLACDCSVDSESIGCGSNGQCGANLNGRSCT